MKHVPRVALGAAALLTLTACAGGSSPQADGDRIRLAYAFVPVAGLSPYSDDAVIGYGIGATETLVRLDPAGAPEPLLATGWTQVDDLTWDVDLRSGVTFHDGTAMTAQAVAESLQHAVDADPSPRALSGVQLGVAAVDEDTVRLTTDAPDPVLPQRLTSPELVVLAPAAYADPTSPSLVGTGTGPYELTAVDGTTGATLDADPDYWGGTPAAEGVDVTFLSDGTSRTAALAADEVDVAQAVPVSQIATLGAGDELQSVPLPRTVSLHLTQTSPVFGDPGLREAAREAVAGLDVAGTVYEGQADAPEGLFGPTSTWAADRQAPGYPTATPPTGQRITLATFSDRAELPEVATAIADALRTIGFDVDLRVGLYRDMEADYLAGTYDAVLMSRSYGQDTADPLSYLSSDFGCAGGYDLSRYCDPAVDAELATGSRLTDVAARNQVALAVERTVLGAVAAVPVVHDRTRFGVADRVTGLAADPWERAIITVDTSV
ncbi:peptide/nickel transport system substrate-binding protein [Klenkia marina]|uniref:Peptide/nickel transport system substrate-binding protein n=1 Tax=Klenkia marina TaxID=1960309 RepID=A0A1G4YLC0_9ACTN|nr:ABC transporter substrate-binding protein [Klenkia marina]SCX54297.1 peptide/nickel transport system substrate-binding protein [Klenkia marina]